MLISQSDTKLETQHDHKTAAPGELSQTLDTRHNYKTAAPRESSLVTVISTCYNSSFSSSFFVHAHSMHARGSQTCTHKHVHMHKSMQVK